MRQDYVKFCKEGALEEYQSQFGIDYCKRHNSITGGAFKYDGKKHTKRDYVELDEKEYNRFYYLYYIRGVLKNKPNFIK